MINIIKSIKVSSAVSAINISNDEVQILDSNYLLNAYSLQDMSILHKHMLSKKQDNRHTYDKSYALSDHLKIYISLYGDHSGLLFTMKNNKLVGKDSLTLHENSVSFASFSHNSGLLAIGDEDGKAFFYDLNIKKVILSLEPRADSISSISFSHNDRYSAICSYDKTVLIYDLDSNKKLSDSTLTDVIEDSIFLNDTNTLAGITRDKRIFKYDSSSNELVYTEFELDEWPSKIIELPENHVLVGTRGTNLYLINSENLELVKKISTQYIGIKSMLFHNNKLFIGYVNGRLELINTDYLSKEFELNLKLDKFEEATKLMEKNIFLLTHKSVKKYDKVWEQVLDIAKDRLVQNNVEEALKLVTPFFFDHKKEEEYRFLSSNKKDIEYFMQLIKDEKDILAFKFADDHEYLKDMKEYNTIELKWQKVYQVCKQMFSKDDMESSQKAIDTLRRYSSINSKKSQVDNLITNYKHFIRAQKLVKARNFKLYFILAGKKPFLTEEALFEKVTQLGHQTYLKLLDLEQKEDFEKAKPIATYLKDFTPFKEKADDHLESIKSKEDMLNYIEADDVEGVYASVSNNVELENFRSFINYHKIYNETKQFALESAKDGNTQEVYNKLDKYLVVNYLEDSISLVFKLSYLMEMEKSAQENMSAIHWPETIKRYVLIYDFDSEILSMIKQLDIESLIMSNESDFKKSTLNKVEYYDSILVYS
ncbi:hypothetical protein N9A28_01495 [Sulfurimonas sp.]|nr:hypothetical protein [Sulfurimonas sp.]